MIDDYSRTLLEQYAQAVAKEVHLMGYTEDMKQAVCPHCKKVGMYWDGEEHVWYCFHCGYEQTREQFFQLIHANPPSEKCRTCQDNYPYCLHHSKTCELSEEYLGQIAKDLEVDLQATMSTLFAGPETSKKISKKATKTSKPKKAGKAVSAEH